MASNPKDGETEAYFLRFMAGEIEGEETVKVMMNPLFWDFLASSLSKQVREYFADEMVKRTMDEDATDSERTRINEKVVEGAKALPGGEQKMRECDANFRASYDRITEGGKFDFLRDWFCGVDEREAEREAGGVGDEAQKEGKFETQMDWTESDAEAEVWLLGRGAVTSGDVTSKLNAKSSAETGRGWEWTGYDSEAEREEVRRQPS